MAGANDGLRNLRFFRRRQPGVEIRLVAIDFPLNKCTIRGGADLLFDAA